MKRAMCAAVLAIMMGAVGTAAAQEADAPLMGEIKVPVRRYKTLPPAAVYRAALRDVRADVRFRDAFAGRADVPSSLARVRVRGADHLVVAAFRTQGDLLCLVPSASGEALRNLFRLPPNLPITAAVLERRMAVNRGQQIIVEGALAGTGAGSKLVLVDSVLAYGSQAPRTRRELHVRWPGAAEPLVIAEPGTTTVAVPCTAQEGQSASIKITVQAMAPEALLAELARATAELEGRPGMRKAYGQYAAGEVYRHAAGDNRVNVDFEDSVLGTVGAELPRELSTVAVLRRGAVVPVPTGYAFQAGSHVACLVPADMPTPMARAASAIPGERVRILGTTVGRMGGHAVVAVDHLSFPDQEAVAGREDVWLVTLEWPGTQPRKFWDYGLYGLVDLPCQSVPNRFEALQLLLAEFRTVKIELPPAAEGEQPAAEPEG